MSRLFLATDLRLRREVVVKVLPPDLVSDASAARFKREIELTVRLQHPHILPILTSGEFEDGLFYITPYIQGESLRARIEREGKLPLDDILRILKDVSGALAFAHQRGIVHRDIKPGNILLSDGQAILADFGIARAVSTTATPLTESGVAPGTPAYMAPELPTDERADVFALAVVAHEMLTGHPSPRAETVRGFLASRGTVKRDSRRLLRSLALLVLKSTSRSIAERPLNAREFLELLNRGPGPHRRVIIVTGLIAAGVVILSWMNTRSVGEQLSDSKLFVWSSASGGPKTAGALRSILLGFGEWRGVSIVNDSGVETVSNLAQASKSARALGAANVVEVEATQDRDSVSVRVRLYDSQSQALIRQSHVTYSANAIAISRKTASRGLINAILRVDGVQPWKDPSDSAPAYLEAWRRYDLGRQALQQWHLSAAEAFFRSAIQIDPNLARAHAWLAQTLAIDLPGANRSELEVEARRAVELGARLEAGDSLRAIAASLLSTRQHPKACAVYQELVRKDSADVWAWLGAGDCQARDSTVVESRLTATGWAFRGSFEEAARKYRIALRWPPPQGESEFRGWLLGRLSSVLFGATNRVRLGFAVARDTQFFGAFPYLDHDTVAFAPHSTRDFPTRRGDPSQRLVQAAIQRNRSILREAAADWARRFPTIAAAYDSLAIWTELSGGVADLGGRRVSTLELVRKARSLATDSTEQLRLAIAEVRDLFKEQRFAEARAEADSVLRRGGESRSRDVAGVIGLVTLVGRVQDAERLWPFARFDHGVRLADGRRWDPPAAILEAEAPFVVRAAFGLGPDSVRLLARRLSDLIDTYAPDSSDAAQVRAAIVARGLVTFRPDLLLEPGLGVNAPDEIVRAAADLAGGDGIGAKERLVRLQGIDKGRAPGNGVRNAFPAALIWLALGDTAQAVRELDDLLRTVRALDPAFLGDVTDVALMVRSMALRAILAARAGDSVTARLYARAVHDLWLSSAPELKDLQQEMQRIVRER